MRVLVTGSNGLIGGEVVEHFGSRGHEVVGVDNNMRRQFFGPAGDTVWNRDRLLYKFGSYAHHNLDIRDLDGLMYLFEAKKGFDAVIHCAAQPSHDKARDIPVVDHSVNATGTLNMLEATRKCSPEAVFIYMSTNKVYGDAPNRMEFREYSTRWDWFPEEWQGFDEGTAIDQSTHSIFGANKLAADIMVQEYARSFGMKTCVFRGGCLTGPGHSGVELHGFLSYLVKMVATGGHYKVIGYKGKQVRDNIHSRDVVAAMEQVIAVPRPGEVYNIGGGRANSLSVLEAIDLAERVTGRRLSWEYIEQARLGDHICYITDLGKFMSHYPGWSVTVSTENIVREIAESLA